MFVRFRQTGSRLHASIIETRRLDGKVRHEHLASLGAVGVPPSVADRAAFWHALHQKLQQLSNRLDTAGQAKILGEVHVRIPMVATDGLRSLQQENLEADERFWDDLRGLHGESIEDHKGLVAMAERTIAAAEAQAKEAAAMAEAASQRLARLKAGEGVAGGLTRLSYDEICRVLREAGWTRSALRHARIVAELSELGGFEEFLAEVHKRHRQAELAAARAVLRNLRSKHRPRGVAGPGGRAKRGP
jgi:hypothetical protein